MNLQKSVNMKYNKPDFLIAEDKNYSLSTRKENVIEEILSF